MKEQEILKEVNEMCVESLDPEVFEQWENVKKWLINNRKNLEQIDENKT